MYKLTCVVIMGLFFATLLGMGAYLSGSIAIATDCAFLAADMLAFAVSIYALKLTRKGANQTYSFGYFRAEILGSIISVVILVFGSAYLTLQAIYRVQKDQNIEG